MDNKWRVINNNYGTISGAESTDILTFRKTPLLSLAREICQNSIDAKKDDVKKVTVEFKSFELKKNEIPGISELVEEINKTCEYNKINNKKEYESMKNIQDSINCENIPCLRISDFNTKGLSRIIEEDGTFCWLTKGNGISDKYELSGGSKGVGKFASFVVSSFNTVFYSTLNLEGERGYIGVNRISSRRIENSKEHTTGISYYCSDNEISPIMEECSIDKSFKRNETGTDIYILGFEKSDDWKIQILKKILDSFLVAIIENELEIIIDDIIVNSSNVGKVINDTRLGNDSMTKSIISQYQLLTDENVAKREFQIEDYGNIIVYVKKYSREEEYLATKKCVMVRYPLMKIKSISNISNFSCSALCIIPKNILSEKLIKIENAQHTDWEVSQIVNNKELKNEYKRIIDLVESRIKDFVKEVLLISESDESDLEGAGDLLPFDDEEKNDTNSVNENVIPEDKPKVLMTKKYPERTKRGIKKSKDGEGMQPDIGDINEGGEGVITPEGINNGNSGSIHDGTNTNGYSEDGDKELMRKIGLVGIKYRLAVLNKEEGEYLIIFNSEYSEKKCELNIFIVDDSGNSFFVPIKECYVNDEKITVEKGIGKDFSIDPGKIRIKIKTDLKEIYSWEVKINAYK